MNEKNYAKIRKSKRLQVDNEQTYFREMFEYITKEKSKSNTARDTSNDKPIDKDLVNNLSYLMKKLNP